MLESSLTRPDPSIHSSKNGPQFRGRVFSGASPITNTDFRAGHILDCGAKSQIFRGCDFSFCLIEYSYFRNCKFENCKFNGTRFISSNLNGATFTQCRFDYSKFVNTEIDHAQIKSQMPSYPNVRRILLRSLRTNATSIGRADDASKFYVMEMDTECEHFNKVAFPTDSWYTEKYSARERLKAFGTLCFRRIERTWWGYGEAPVSLLTTTAVLVLSISLLTTGTQECDFRTSLIFVLGSAIGVSVSGLKLPDTQGIQIISLISGLVGFITLSLFVAILLRRIARR